MSEPRETRYTLDGLQRTALTLMAALTLLSFAATNMQALLWQSSSWLVSTVLPAVVVDLTNEERAENAAPELRRNATLDAAAQMKAEHMAKHEYFSHFSPDGVSPWHWFNEAEYVYAHAGENLAVHFTDSSEVVEAWMDSPTHRANIVNEQFTEIGVGTAKGEFQGYDTVYVVQLFGTPGAAVDTVADAATSEGQPVPEPAPESTEPAPASTPAESVVSPITETTSSPQTTLTANEFDGPTPAFAGAESTPEAPSESPSPASEPSAALDPEGAPETEPILLVQDADPATATATNSVPVAPAEVVSEWPTMQTATPTETVVVTSPTISTSSGLAIAQITNPNPPHAGATMASLITRPNTLLQLMYLALGTVVVFLLSLSIVFEARRHHFVQVAYGFALLLGMGGLWYVQSWLLGGALIV